MEDALTKTYALFILLIKTMTLIKRIICSRSLRNFKADYAIMMSKSATPDAFF